MNKHSHKHLKKLKPLISCLLALSISLLFGACSKNNALLQDGYPSDTGPWLNDNPNLPSTTHNASVNDPGLVLDGDVIPGTTYYADEYGQLNDSYNSGGNVKSGLARSVKDAAEKQSDVKNAAVVVTHQGHVLVALDLKDNVKNISSATRNAILNASNNSSYTRITTDAAHYAEVRTLEAASNGATIAGDRIKDIWDAIT